MKSLIFGSIFLFNLNSYASILETAFKVKISYQNPEGKIVKLAPVRASLQYNPEAKIFSENSKKDCRALAGKRDLFSFWTETFAASCFSYKNSVIVPEDYILALLYRSNSFSLFMNPSKLDTIILNNAFLSNLTNTEIKTNQKLIFAIRNLLGLATKTQIVSLTQSNKYVLKGDRADSFIVEIEPRTTKVIR